MWQSVSICRIALDTWRARKRTGAYRNVVLELLEKGNWGMAEKWFLSGWSLVSCIIVRSDCDMLNSDPSRLQDQWSGRTKLKQIVKTIRMKTTGTAIAMVSIRPGTMCASVHVCVWSTQLHRESCSQRPFFVQWNVQCIRGRREQCNMWHFPQNRVKIIYRRKMLLALNFTALFLQQQWASLTVQLLMTPSHHRAQAVFPPSPTGEGNCTAFQTVLLMIWKLKVSNI